MKKSEYVQYLKQRHFSRISELSKLINVSHDKYESMIKSLSDDAIIDSYRICAHCGKEGLSKKEMDSLIQKYDDPDRIFNEMPSGHE